MKYYFLQRGDYLQLGDEYLDKDNAHWKSIPTEFIGRCYGYDTKNQRANWPKVRRLVPDDFEIRKGTIEVPIQEQWGEEFER